MKQLFLIITLWLLIPLTIERYQSMILAAEEEATSSAETELDERIKGIKEGVAEKVARLKLLQNRAFSGRIDSLESKSFYLETKIGEMILVQINEATTIKTQGKTTTLDKLSQDEKIVAWGRFNSEEKSLSAQKIISRSLPQGFIGQIENIDIDNDRLTVRHLIDNQSVVVETEKINTIHQLDKDDDFVKKRLKDLMSGDTIYLYGFASDPESFAAHRLLIINAASQPTPSDKKY